MIINYHFKAIKQKNKKWFKPILNLKKTEKNLHQNPVDTKLYPRSFPKIQNNFGVCGQFCIPTLICIPH